jgi:hypothetical protein
MQSVRFMDPASLSVPIHYIMCLLIALMQLVDNVPDSCVLKAKFSLLIHTFIKSQWNILLFDWQGPEVSIFEDRRKIYGVLANIYFVTFEAFWFTHIHSPQINVCGEEINVCSEIHIQYINKLEVITLILASCLPSTVISLRLPLGRIYVNLFLV